VILIIINHDALVKSLHMTRKCTIVWWGGDI